MAPHDRKKMAVTQKNSRRAVTHWEVIARYPGVTHLRCRLKNRAMNRKTDRNRQKK